MQKKKIIEIDIIIAMLFAIIVCIAYSVNAYAASDVKVKIAGGTVEQGKEITVVATITSDSIIGPYDAYILYDTEMLEFKSGSASKVDIEGERDDGYAGELKGGNGRIKIMSEACLSKSVKIELVFLAKQPGEHSVYFADASECEFYDRNGEFMNMVSTSGTVKVNAPALFSSDNTLSIIYAYSVFENGSTKPAWYWPDFSPERTSYDLVVEGDVTKLNITATPNHNKATLTVSDTTMKVGSNKVVITVTAEDGSKKEYVINVTKNEKVTEPPTTQPPTTTQKPEEPTTTLPKEDIKVTIGTKEYILMNYSDEMTIPEGYELFETTYKEQPIVALKGLGTEIILMALSEDGKTIIDFIYNQKTGEFQKFNLVNILSSQYVILEMISDLGEITMPNGYTLKSVNIGGKVVDAYANDTNALYIVYAMNWNGENSLYYYDSIDNTMMKYFTVTNGDIGYTEERETTTNTETKPVGGNVSDNDDKDGNADSQEVAKLKERQQLIIIAAIVIILILLGIIIAMAVSKNKDDEDFEDEYEEDDESEEDDDDDESDEEDGESDEEIEDEVDSDVETENEANSDDKSKTLEEELAKYTSNMEALAALEEIAGSETDDEKEESVDDKTEEDSFEEEAVEVSSNAMSVSSVDVGKTNSNNVNQLLEDDSKSLESDELDMVLDDILDGLSK